MEVPVSCSTDRFEARGEAVLVHAGRIDTGAAITAAGFSRVELRRLRMPLPEVAPHIVGFAIR